MKNRNKTRCAKKKDFPDILTVWKRAVSATHHFLDPADFHLIYTCLRDKWLEATEVIRIAENNGTIVAFIGLNPPKVEMLFVDPGYMGKGYGTVLLDSARHDWPHLEVDVNEQNSDALHFYEKYGFKKTGRSKVDGQGKPYPLIHMRLDK